MASKMVSRGTGILLVNYLEKNTSDVIAAPVYQESGIEMGN